MRGLMRIKTPTLMEIIRNLSGGNQQKVLIARWLLTEPDRFRTADSSTQSRVIEAIARTGAKAILTLPEPPCSSPECQWQRLGNTDYYAHLLNTAAWWLE